MTKKSSEGGWIILYPFLGVALLVKKYFVLIILAVLMGAITWFAAENYRVYTQGRAEYTSYLPSLFRRDRKGDKTVLNYMTFEPSRLIDDYFPPVRKAVPVSNAKVKKHSGEGVKVTSSVAESDRGVTLTATDTSGEDGSSAKQAKVFLPQETADTQEGGSIQQAASARLKSRGTTRTIRKKKNKKTLEK